MKWKKLSILAGNGHGNGKRGAFWLAEVASRDFGAGGASWLHLVAKAEWIQQPSPTLPRDNQPQKELRTSLAAGEDFSGFISPEELEVHPDPSASDLVHPPPKLLCWELRGWVS